ncbi:hypothetical protein K7X08_038094 [Anisodus acutangulus]|uniref:U1-type domain-containing protein n=1 Tax=Anisodus acutangulus TaxID=402998 RepID=A0A9Q1RQ03_9SOLA|nr:hypothetical protein K7X08_038094 [Anisodus acutangulus]
MENVNDRTNGAQTNLSQHRVEVEKTKENSDSTSGSSPRYKENQQENVFQDTTKNWVEQVFNNDQGIIQQGDIIDVVAQGILVHNHGLTKWRLMGLKEGKLELETQELQLRKLQQRKGKREISKMDFLRYTLYLIDFLAWPVLALAYPLSASIRAIETGSKYHMRKLVTYWTIFSFISLFEHLFEKLIEWIPMWPYIKLITICWLVIPQFNNACYLYQNLIHPCFPVKLYDSISQFNSSCYVYQHLLYLCLSLKLQTVTDWFNKPMEYPSLKNETFPAVAERYLEENGSDALEKLIANKDDHHAEEIKPTDTSDEAGMLTPNQIVCEEGGPVWEDIKVTEHMGKHEAAEPKQLKSVKENHVQIEKKTTAVQIKETAFPADAEKIKLPATNSVKNVQTEWSCAVCQVTTKSKHDLKCHLHGRRHREKCVELKSLKKTAKTERNTPFTSKMPDQLKREQVKHALAAQKKHNTNEKPKEKVHLGAAGQHEKQKQVKNAGGATQNSRLWCSFCKVRCPGEIDMAAHLIGRKHFTKLQEAMNFTG